MKRYILITFTLLAQIVFGQQSVSVEHSISDIENEEFVYYRPINLFEDPSLLLDDFGSSIIPTKFYSTEEVNLQKKINEKEEGILTFSEGDNREFPRAIDKEDITPYTWKWVYLQVKEEDGSYTNVRLRRPNWWFLEKKIRSIGDAVHVNIPQVGLDEIVNVVAIYPNQLDTRFWEGNKQGNIVARPITGKVEHYVNNVVDLHFEEGSNPLSVTTNHLLWSYDQNDWVKVADLVIGEKVTTKRGVVTVKDRIKKEGWYTVYDIEVYRDHNFLVGLQNVLAHNSCEFNPSGKINDRKIRKNELAGQTVKTPGGPVKIDASGFPDFTKYAKYTVRIEDMQGNLSTDVTKALNKLGLKRKDIKHLKDDFVWHHHQDGKSMMLIPKNVHNTTKGGVGHTGGAAVVKHNKKYPDNQLNYPSPPEKLE